MSDACAQCPDNEVCAELTTLRFKIAKARELVDEYEKQFGYEGMFDPLKECLADKQTEKSE